MSVKIIFKLARFLTAPMVSVRSVVYCVTYERALRRCKGHKTVRMCVQKCERGHVRNEKVLGRANFLPDNVVFAALLDGKKFARVLKT